MLATLQLDLARTIANVHLLGQGFFQVVLTDPEATSFALKANPLPLGDRMIFFMPFYSSFDPLVEDSCLSSVFINFPSLHQVFHQLHRM